MNKAMAASAKREEVLRGSSRSIANSGEQQECCERAAHWPSPLVAWGWVAVLLAAYASAFADRQILSLLVEQIKADLHVSDTQFGLLQGLSFALLYTTSGIPIGALIDRTSRRRIVACGVITWSIMTAACGIASQYWQLFVARIGVGVGEGSLSPSAFAILADMFPPKRLPLALSIYTSGSGLGSGLALIAGGTVVQLAATSAPVVLPLLGPLKTWQLVFIVLGLPGILLGSVIALMPEPRRRVTAVVAPEWRDVRRFLINNRRFLLYFVAGVAAASTTLIATLAWGPALLMRVYHQSPHQVALELGPVIIVALTAGLITGAWTTSLFTAAKRADAIILSCMVGAFGLIITASLGLLVREPHAAVLTIGAILFFASQPAGVAAAAVQSITPVAMRGRVSAIYLFSHTGTGSVLGPLIPGVLADRFFGAHEHFGSALLLPAIVLGFLLLVLMHMARHGYVTLTANDNGVVT